MECGTDDRAGGHSPFLDMFPRAIAKPLDVGVALRSRASNLRHRSLPVDFDIFFAATTGDCEHDANTDRDHDSD